MSQSKHMKLNLVLGVVLVCIAAFALGAVAGGFVAGPEPCAFIGTWNGTENRTWTFSQDGKIAIVQEGAVVFNNTYTVISPDVVSLAPEFPDYVYLVEGDTFSRIAYTGDGVAHRISS